MQFIATLSKICLSSYRRHAKWSRYGNGDSESGQAKRLLIVDDEPAITRLLEMIARQNGFAAMSIHDPRHFEAALEKVKPTIIFLDIAMPRRDGLELIGYLATWNYPGRVVVMSGSDERYIQMSSQIAKTRGLWVAGTLAKPFRRDAVVDLLTSLAT
jgi:DNA-binding response OmpR family regulator